MSDRKIRGVEQNESVDRKRLLRDVRTFGQKFFDLFQNTNNVISLFLCISLFVLFFPVFYLLSFMLFGFVFLLYRSANSRPRLPFRIPKSANLIDYGDPIPGRKKYNKSSGVFFVGNELRQNKELWLKDKDLLTHMLIFGTTGSGKTETLVSLACNSVAMGSGLFYIDPKAAPKLAFQIYILARICGRDDDFRVLNYGTGGKAVNAKSPKRLSNTQNPFAFGSAENLSQLLISLIPSSEGGNAIFGQNAQVLITSLMYALVELRDRGEIELSIEKIREYTTLQNLHELATQKHFTLSERSITAVKSFLHSLGWQDNTALQKQPRSLPEQFGYARMYFNLSLQSFADSYGHIYRTTMGEIDMYDVIMNRRIMVTMLPSLEKAPQELQNLGKISLSAVRNAISVGLGDKIEGSAEDVLESLPTDAPTPFLTIVDEYAAIPTEGFAEILTQGRGLGVAAIVASQDYDGITKADEKGAGQIVANTKIKFCMTLEDPKSTWDLFNAIAGETTVVQTQGFSINKDQPFQFNYRDQLSTSTEKISRIHIQDLQEQIEGEFHAFFKGDVLRGMMFYANPPLNSDLQLRINQMLEISSPSEQYVRSKSKEAEELLNVLMRKISNNEIESVENIKDFIVRAKVMHSAKTYIGKAITGFMIGVRNNSKGSIFEHRSNVEIEREDDDQNTIQERYNEQASTDAIDDNETGENNAEEIQDSQTNQNDINSHHEDANIEVEDDQTKKISDNENSQQIKKNLQSIQNKTWDIEELYDATAAEDFVQIESKYQDEDSAKEQAENIQAKIEKEVGEYPPHPRPKVKDNVEVKNEIFNLISGKQ